jgi:hypothetical protein
MLLLRFDAAARRHKKHCERYDHDEFTRQS